MSNNRFCKIYYCVHEIAEFKYFLRQMMYLEPPDHILQNLLSSSFNFVGWNLKKWHKHAILQKLVIKLQAPNILLTFEMNLTL